MLEFAERASKKIFRTPLQERISKLTINDLGRETLFYLPDFEHLPAAVRMYIESSPDWYYLSHHLCWHLRGTPLPDMDHFG